MASGGIPRPSAAALAVFRSLIPDVAGVTTRPMFGNQAAFLNGNMFAGLFGDALFVRIDEEGREMLLAVGGSDFAPMPGRPMRGYTCLAPGWQAAPEVAGDWVRRALAHTATLPAKARESRTRTGTRAAT
jgi:TfoX/Sxy family transcriptional regulator of competence genes